MDKGGKVQATKLKDVPTKHSSEIKSLRVANNGKFFVTCSDSGTAVPSPWSPLSLLPNAVLAKTNVVVVSSCAPVVRYPGYDLEHAR